MSVYVLCSTVGAKQAFDRSSKKYGPTGEWTVLDKQYLTLLVPHSDDFHPRHTPTTETSLMNNVDSSARPLLSGDSAGIGVPMDVMTPKRHHLPSFVRSTNDLTEADQSELGGVRLYSI